MRTKSLRHTFEGLKADGVLAQLPDPPSVRAVTAAVADLTALGAASMVKVAVLVRQYLATTGSSGCSRRLGAALRTRQKRPITSDRTERPWLRSQRPPKSPSSLRLTPCRRALRARRVAHADGRAPLKAARRRAARQAHPARRVLRRDRRGAHDRRRARQPLALSVAARAPAGGRRVAQGLRRHELGQQHSVGPPRRAARVPGLRRNGGRGALRLRARALPRHPHAAEHRLPQAAAARGPLDGGPRAARAARQQGGGGGAAERRLGRRAHRAGEGERQAAAPQRAARDDHLRGPSPQPGVPRRRRRQPTLRAAQAPDPRPDGGGGRAAGGLDPPLVGHLEGGRRRVDGAVRGLPRVRAHVGNEAHLADQPGLQAADRPRMAEARGYRGPESATEGAAWRRTWPN